MAVERMGQKPTCAGVHANPLLIGKRTSRKTVGISVLCIRKSVVRQSSTNHLTVAFIRDLFARRTPLECTHNSQTGNGCPK
jgi:hypothetical protein